MTPGPGSGAQRSPIDRAMDLLVYAPLGLALAARDELPKLIAKGRQESQGQVAMARVVGKFAVGRGQKEASKFLREASGRLAGLGLVPDPARTAKAAAEPSPPPSAPPPPSPASGPAAAPPAPSEPSAAPPAATGPAPAPASAGASPDGGPDGLAIPGYDSLSAPHVVQRLDGLSSDELEAVRSYEASHRGRKTILSRIAQLQSPSVA